MRNTRKCPATGCGEPIDSATFMCGPHWRLVPYGMRKEIYAAYDDWLAGEIGGAELRRRQQPAIDAVNGKLAARATL